LVVDNHLPDLWTWHIRRTARERAGNDPFQQAGMRQMIDSSNAVHVARRDRVECGQLAWAPVFQKMFSDRAQRGVRTSQPTRGTDGDNRAVGNQGANFFQGDYLGSRHN
jgi:hypothetical protein